MIVQYTVEDTSEIGTPHQDNYFGPNGVRIREVPLYNIFSYQEHFIISLQKHLVTSTTILGCPSCISVSSVTKNCYHIWCMGGPGYLASGSGLASVPRARTRLGVIKFTQNYICKEEHPRSKQI